MYILQLFYLEGQKEYLYSMCQKMLFLIFWQPTQAKYLNFMQIILALAL